MVLGPLLRLKVFYGSSVHKTINSVDILVAFLEECHPEDPSTGTTAVVSRYSTFAKRSLVPLKMNEDDEEEDSDIKIQTYLISEGRETGDNKRDPKIIQASNSQSGYHI
ncbi:unnamed protein product [Aspergillus oryzae]|nr:unnamed protein product [Aspergillus oryzae]